MKVTNLPFAVSFIKFNISFSIPIMKSLNEPDSSSIPSKSDELFTIVSIKVKNLTSRVRLPVKLPVVVLSTVHTVRTPHVT